jgi:hypothetical protein
VPIDLLPAAGAAEQCECTANERVAE